MPRACSTALEQSLGFDRAPVQISPMTEFGIVAITRKRLREPLARRTSVACAACDGPGAAPVRRKRGAGNAAPGRTRGRRQPGRRTGRHGAPPDVVAWLTRHDDEVAPGSGAARRGPGAFRGGRNRAEASMSPPLTRRTPAPSAASPRQAQVCAFLFPALRRHRSGPLAEGRLRHSRRAGRRCGQGTGWPARRRRSPGELRILRRPEGRPAPAGQGRTVL